MKKVYVSASTNFKAKLILECKNIASDENVYKFANLINFYYNSEICVSELFIEIFIVEYYNNFNSLLTK